MAVSLPLSLKLSQDLLAANLKMIYLCCVDSEFCNVVLKIHLYTKEEVANANGDSQSCLAALMMEASKSSSGSQPDSSPTVTRV